MGDADAITVRRLNMGDESVLKTVADDVFDHEIRKDLASQFIGDAENLLVVALDNDLVVGMGSGGFHFHPDKERELWINELGVSHSYQRRGIATKILMEMQSIARGHGCRGCWLLTEPGNVPANALYASMVGWTGPEAVEMYSVNFSVD